MTKLYYTSATGCDSPYIRAFANGIHDLECEQVDLAEHTTMQGVNFYSINSRGTAPCLVLNDGSVISDKLTVLSYIEQHHVRIYLFF
jgi:glutathione S-transferase